MDNAMTHTSPTSPDTALFAVASPCRQAIHEIGLRNGDVSALARRRMR